MTDTAVLRAAVPRVRPSLAALRLSAAISVLAAVAAAFGLFWPGGTAPDAVTSVHGERVELFGEGLYRYDSLFKAAGNRGTDVITLVLVVPLLLLARRYYRTASTPGALAFVGVLAWILYLYGSLTLGTAYNEFFLGYVALAGMSLFALACAVRSVDLSLLPEDVLDRLPLRRLAAVLLVSAALTAFVWLEPVITAALAGQAPAMLLHSTTLVTEALDLAVVAPAAVLAAVLLLRRRHEGILMGVPLLVLLWTLAPVIVLQTVFQLAAGWDFTPPQLIGPIVGFVALGIAATATLVPTLRRLRDPGPALTPA